MPHGVCNSPGNYIFNFTFSIVLWIFNNFPRAGCVRIHCDGGDACVIHYALVAVFIQVQCILCANGVGLAFARLIKNEILRSCSH